MIFDNEKNKEEIINRATFVMFILNNHGVPCDDKTNIALRLIAIMNQLAEERAIPTDSKGASERLYQELDFILTDMEK